MPRFASALAPFVVALAVAATGCAGSGGPSVLGAEAAADGRWDVAYEEYARAVRREPAKLEHRRERVRAAQRSGKLADLEESLRGQISRGGDSAPTLYELALTVATLGEPGSDRDAVELLQQAAAGLPEAGDIRYRIGLLRLEQENFAEAVAPLARAVELESGSSRYRVAFAAALAADPDQQDRAREVLALLPTLSPSERELARARSILAGINTPARHIPEGLRDTYREAVAALSEEAPSTGEAVQLIEEALAAAPDCAPFVVLNGLASVRLGRLGQARAAFLRAIELWEGDPTPWLELAALDEEADDMAEAEEHLEAALAADPLSIDGWAELGRIRYHRNRFGEAAEAFQRLIAVDGGRVLGRLWLGRSLRRAGRDEEAERVYQGMLDGDQASYEAYLQLGHIYRRRRIREEDRARSAALLERAIAYYRQALEVRPQDPQVQRLIQALEDER